MGEGRQNLPSEQPAIFYLSLVKDHSKESYSPKLQGALLSLPYVSPKCGRGQTSQGHLLYSPISAANKWIVADAERNLASQSAQKNSLRVWQ